MKKVFVYGILLQDIDGPSFGIKSDFVKAKAKLPNFKRESTSYIRRENGSHVEGEYLELPDELEEEIYRFEKQFGYERSLESIITEDGKMKEDVIVYLVED